jgi:serine/threonine protein phosphatase PrpC
VAESADSDQLDERADTTNKSKDSLEQPSFSPKSNFFVVVASDGIWEQVSIDEVGRRVAQHGRENLDGVCNALVQDARRKWITTRGGVSDDISVLVAWF